MTWGFFSVCHIISLAFAIGIIVSLYYILKSKSNKVKTSVLGILSFAGILAIIFNLVKWGSPIEYLPFHLCSLNAMVLPVAVFTKSKVLNNLLLLWAVGAFCALVINSAQADFEIFSLTFVFYYFPHVLELGIPILMFALGLSKKELRCIISTLGITIGSYTAIHLINVWLNSYIAKKNLLDFAGNLIEVNYMYSIRPENPVLQLFYNIIPHSYWYMYLAFVVIAIYLGAVYTPEIIKAINLKKQKQA